MANTTKFGMYAFVRAEIERIIYVHFALEEHKLTDKQAVSRIEAIEAVRGTRW